jgi:hypothetical protein
MQIAIDLFVSPVNNILFYSLLYNYQYHTNKVNSIAGKSKKIFKFGLLLLELFLSLRFFFDSRAGNKVFLFKALEAVFTGTGYSI